MGTATQTTLTAGIDWFEATLSNTYDFYSNWRLECQNALNLVKDHGNITRDGWLNGYHGLWCGSLFIGERADTGYVKVSGDWAGRLFSRLFHTALHIARLDVQTTAKLAVYDREAGKRWQAEAELYNLRYPVQNRRKIRFTGETAGGYGFYVGTRNSRHYLNCYDKWAESAAEEYENCWRFEVRYKNDAATQVGNYIFVAPYSQPRVCSSIVWRYCAERGITCPWDRECEESATWGLSREPTDIDKQLAWLEKQVAPTVKRLLTATSRDIVMLALGLWEGQGHNVLQSPTQEGQDNG